MRLREELVLLGHDPSGRPVLRGDALDAGVAGARLAELVLAARVGVRDGRLAVTEALPTGDPDADALLAALMRAPEPPAVAAALAELRPGAAGHVRDDLIADGTVTRVTARRLGLVSVTRYPAEEAAVRTVSVRLWYAAHGRSQPDERTAALCGLVHAVLLHDHVFVTMPLPGLDQRLREIRAGLCPPVREIVDGVAALVPVPAFAIHR